MADLSKSTGASRAQSARQRAEEMRLQEEGRARRTKALIVTLTSLIVAALAITVFVVVQDQRQKQAAAEAGPAGLSEHGGVLSGKDEAKVTVTTYFDYMCPACNQFEQTYSEPLKKLEDEGKIKQELVPISILDRFSNGTKYSTRSAAAGYCVAASDQTKLPAFTKAMFAQQPPENSEGLPNTKIAEIAASAGVSEAGQKCIKDGKYAGYATKVTDEANKAGVSGTPSVMVNGKLVDRTKGETLEAALKKAGVTLAA